MHFDNVITERIPIKNLSMSAKTIFDSIVDVVVTAHKYDNNDIVFFFERLLNALIYELYFPAELTSTGIQIAAQLTNLPTLQANWTKDQKPPP